MWIVHVRIAKLITAQIQAAGYRRRKRDLTNFMGVALFADWEITNPDTTKNIWTPTHPYQSKSETLFSNHVR
jgi:hypothetical protein